jgi:hypothetical protein
MRRATFSRRFVPQELIGGEAPQSFNLFVHRLQQLLQDLLQFLVGRTRNQGTEMADSVIEATSVHRF